ncbi:glycoside hydrolase family 3 protein [Parasediminibacterium sp. JCM 36343]|uniref:glycoside hydrolase family 3 protein n=1 Tax=Parasediminibacterium sp. JCM 36343 TaxID=3374279 RepID=UPI0039795B4C
MKKIIFTCLFFIFVGQPLIAQQFYTKSHSAKRWVKQQFKKLSKEECIAQLMVIRAHSNLGPEHVQQVTNLIKQYNVGGLCFFQGGPLRQALLTNNYQGIAKTPLMVCMDAEWGLGMRLDSVTNYPRQLMIGATQDSSLVYEMGKAIGSQCKRMGVQVNYAPVVDINNNPENPVINDRSFGEDKYKVARFGTQYMLGMQAENIMACAKHFPGHGDVAVDSHLDLPVIYKSRQALDSLELYPFKKMISGGVGSMMMAHLYIPAIDTTAHLATSLSAKSVTGILRDELHFKGITFTDALEMKGISKFFPSGEASVLSLIAGNDMLCLPSDVPEAIAAIKQAIKERRLSWKKINKSVKKVLLAKYNLGLAQLQPIDTSHLVAELNISTDSIKRRIAENALTLLRTKTAATQLRKGQRIAYIGIGISKESLLATRLKNELNCDNYFFSGDLGKSDTVKETIEPQLGVKVYGNKINISAAQQLINTLQQKQYDAIIIGVHNYSRRPANNFGLDNASIYLLKALQQTPNPITIFFGNPYAIKFACDAPTLLACYEDDSSIQQVAADWLEGKLIAKGKLPVTVCGNLKFGDGVVGK